MHALLVWGKTDAAWKSTVQINKVFVTSDRVPLGWLSDSNNYGEYVRNCSIFIVPPDAQGAIKYANAGCTSAGWQWSHWLVRNDLPFASPMDILGLVRHVY